MQHRRSQSGRLLTVDHGLHVSNSLHMRPVSVGVCPLSNIISGGQKVSSDHEMTETVKMFSCDEKDHYQLHSWIIKGNGKVIHPPPSGPHNIVLKMRLLTGSLHQIRKNNEVFEVKYHKTSNNCQTQDLCHKSPQSCPSSQLLSPI